MLARLWPLLVLQLMLMVAERGETAAWKGQTPPYTITGRGWCHCGE